jgi:hypothetical protein
MPYVKPPQQLERGRSNRFLAALPPHDFAISVLKGGPNRRVDLEMMNREAKLHNRSAPKRKASPKTRLSRQ